MKSLKDPKLAKPMSFKEFIPKKKDFNGISS